MKTGIIIYSYTNNTLTVGERVKSAFSDKQHEVCLERVTALNEEPNSGKTPVLKDKPSASTYDYIIFGAPVRAFTLVPVMNDYLAQLPPLSGKKVACFVTQHFPKPWLGGNRAISKMVRHVKRLGGDVIQTAVVNWSGKEREAQIDKLAVSFAGAAAGEKQ